MNRMRVVPIHKIALAGVVAFLLLGAPLHLGAQEREAAAVERVSVIGWLSGLWNDLAAWLNEGVTPQRPDQPTDNLQNGCIVDPHGGCRD